jgi:hypothetical protein
MTDPDHLSEEPGAHRDKLTAPCPELTGLTSHVSAFAKLLDHHEHPAGELRIPSYREGRDLRGVSCLKSGGSTMRSSARGR